MTGITGRGTTRARDNVPTVAPTPQVTSDQVAKDAPKQILRPPPGMSQAVDREAHYSAAARDDARAKERFKQTTRETFLAAAAKRREQQPQRQPGRGMGMRQPPPGVQAVRRSTGIEPGGSTAGEVRKPKRRAD